LHGDAKADNLVAEGDRVILLDLDRCAWGDPALDLGKLIADLRWWAGGSNAARLIRGLRVGYGDGVPGQWERARLLAVVFQLKLAARRTPIHLPGWAQRIRAAVAEAAQYLSMERAA
jgi:aminoglycoside phosphotransferase (APT) family kinase protein